MIFARYRGPCSEGTFTEGRTYLARPHLEEGEVEDLERIRITDDNGYRVTIDPEDGRFDYFEEVYAVVLTEVRQRPPGSVVVADDISDDEKFLHASEIGYLKRELLEILDETTLAPGTWVMDLSTGIWTKVERVNEKMWIMPDGFEEMRSPGEFQFAVSDGCLAVEPLVCCTDDEGVEGLTKGFLYRLTMTGNDGLVNVVNDEGHNMTYSLERFEKNF